MKIIFRANEENQTKIYLESENQEESHDIMLAAKMVKKPVKAYGNVDKSRTWAWFFIPNKKQSEYETTSFDNEK